MTPSMTLASLAEHLLNTQGVARRIVAIAGAPGSGKSTFAEALGQSLNDASPGMAAVMGMDGFHFDDRILNARGHRARKGAPHTFDAGGLDALLGRLRADVGSDIAIPVFDRDLEIARAGAAIVAGSVRLIVIEGNYLLLDDPAWQPLRRHFDLSVMLDVPRDVVVQRLTARWQGYDYTPEQLRTKLDGNDLPNADLVLTRSVAADVVVGNG
jgi:pantothenate kinase